ncbi:hypothetical protein CNMCM5623_002847 [Aspergillus felis]|uniref:Uncharacterized protein n=1 Tax=Aspergillus felis TaxID=1287682 RepID=A0A8H6PQE1_9EURO|nr:hypothetical protein CNMCM5623_002847 [Aspergillus felis]
MEQLSFREAIVKAAVVGWDDLFREWLEREENFLRNDDQRYQFAQYLDLLLHYNPSLSFSQIEIVLREIRTNSSALRRCDRRLAGCLDSNFPGALTQGRGNSQSSFLLHKVAWCSHRNISPVWGPVGQRQFDIPAGELAFAGRAGNPDGHNALTFLAESTYQSALFVRKSWSNSPVDVRCGFAPRHVAG